MIALQAINKILDTKDFDKIYENSFDRSYFPDYENEFGFIKNQVEQYNQVPDIETFLDKFPDFDRVRVNEPWDYIIEKLNEEHLYSRAVPILQHAADLLAEDSNQAISYLQGELRNVKTNTTTKGTDIIHQSRERYEELLNKRNNAQEYYYATGFNELDLITNGLQRGEELVVLFARTNQGKSFVAEKIAVEIWKQGANVGYFSPEMSANSIAYRFDSLFKNYSNHSLMTGRNVDDSYEQYINELTSYENKFLVTTPIDFNRKPNVSKIRAWALQNDLQFIVIDGLKYLRDERYRRGDSLQTTLTNISEDLMALSVELKIPIIAVVQANRNATGDGIDDTPTLETISNADGIAHNASLVISMRNKNGVLELSIEKNRNGSVGNKLTYSWNIDLGEFIYKPNRKSGLGDYDEEVTGEIATQYNDTESVF